MHTSKLSKTPPPAGGRQEFELVTFRDERTRDSREPSWVKVAQKSFPIDGDQAAKNTRPFLDPEYNLLTTMSNFGPLRQKLLQDLLLRKNADNKDSNTIWIIDFVYPGKEEIERGRRKPPRSFWVVLKRTKKEKSKTQHDIPMGVRGLRRQNTIISQNNGSTESSLYDYPNFSDDIKPDPEYARNNLYVYDHPAYQQPDYTQNEAYDTAPEYSYSNQVRDFQNPVPRTNYAAYREPMMQVNQGPNMYQNNMHQNQNPRGRTMRSNSMSDNHPQLHRSNSTYNMGTNQGQTFGNNRPHPYAPNPQILQQQQQQQQQHQRNMNGSIDPSWNNSNNNTENYMDPDLEAARTGREMFQEYPSPDLKKQQSQRDFNKLRSTRHSSRSRVRGGLRDNSDRHLNDPFVELQYQETKQRVDNHGNEEYILRKKMSTLDSWVHSDSTTSSADDNKYEFLSRPYRGRSKTGEIDTRNLNTNGRSRSHSRPAVMLPRRNTAPSREPPLARRASKSRHRKYEPSDDESEDTLSTHSDEECTNLADAVKDFHFDNGLHHSRSFRNVRFHRS